MADADFLARLRPHMPDLDVTCKTLVLPAAPVEQAVVIEASPMRRIP